LRKYGAICNNPQSAILSQQFKDLKHFAYKTLIRRSKVEMVCQKKNSKPAPDFIDENLEKRF